ncbi:MAG: hypothetical protein ABGY42_06605 [bacterium]
MMYFTRASAAFLLAIGLLLPAAAAALDKSLKCVIQLDKESGMAILAVPSTEPRNEALAYPLTDFGDAAPGDLVVLHSTKGVTLKVTSKADQACLKLVPVADPHAHHSR